MAGLEELIGRVAGTPLDRTRPLWEMHVCEPFDDGRIAVITKMHHALADGVAANALLGNIVDGVSSDPRPARDRPARAIELEPTPSWFDQLRMALVDAVLQIGRLPGLVSRTAKAVAAVLRHRRASAVPVPRPLLDVPRTPFNGALTARRNFATAQLQIADIKEVQRAHGVTMNDVVLAIVGGALRRWLGAHDQLPARSLVAGVPVAADAPGAEPRLGGNRVSNIFTSLATDLDDPHERLAAISRTTGESKLIHQTLGATMLVDWVQFTPPAPMTAVMRLYSRSRAAAYHPPPFNVVVSNVRGPGEPVSISGAHLRDLYSVGPILEGIGLNVTAWSYVDRMNFSLLGCPDLVDDLGPLVDELPRALDELRTTKGLPA
jgi:diacylglycerol O-acyltransferase